MKCKHKLLQLAYEMCITSRFYMGYNLSYKLCILNSVVIHLGMKIIHTGIADKIPNLCQHVMKNCLDPSLFRMIIFVLLRVTLSSLKNLK